MGSVGKGTSAAAQNTQQVSINSALYDIEEKAESRGYDSAADMISEDLSDISFTTRKQELKDSIEDLGYEIVDDNGEYFTIVDDRDDSDSEFSIRYSNAGSTWYLNGAVRKLR